ENQQKILREKAMSLPEFAFCEIEEFIDNGHTGTNFERPAVQRLLDMVRTGEISCIIVKDFSRFGRNSIETGYFIQKVFPLYHVRFISVSDSYDSAEHKGDTGGMDIAFKYLINECYSRDLSVKSKTAKMARMKRGEYQSKVCPYGYQKGADGRMIPDEETADNVRKIFEWAADGFNATEIAHKLYELKIPTPGEVKSRRGSKTHDVSRVNGVWCISTVFHILEDERYTGMYVINKRHTVEIGSTHVRMNDESEWIKIPDHHEPIISKELFEKAKSKIRKFKLPNKQPRDYLLRGKVFCGCCDHALNVANGRHFKCRYSEKIAEIDCHGLSVPIKDLETVVFDTLRAQASCVIGIGDLSAAELSASHQAEYTKKLCDLQERKRGLYESFVLGEITAEDYKARKLETDALIADVRNVIAAAAEQAKSVREEYEENLRQKKIADELQAADTLTKSLVELLIKRVYVFPDNKIEIEYLSRSFF
ncbi:MAG: recombinase family protein, partial [Lachnospiraceae bacterium]|nr:recombinase family protein [Lachnospiraceae bacterium]